MFVRLNSDDVLLLHVKGWMKWFKEFRKNSTVFDGLKITSQFDAHVYMCERSELNIVADWIGFFTMIIEACVISKEVYG